MATVKATNIASSLTKDEVSHFFSFCGKIESLDLEPSSEDGGATQVATIRFVKKVAAETALLLPDAQLGPNKIVITADSADVTTEAGSKAAEASGTGAQEGKSNTRIFAEMLSHGYILSDKTIAAGADLDKKHGISENMNKILSSASENVAQFDQKYHLSESVTPYWQKTTSLLGGVFAAAKSSPVGAKVQELYADGKSRVNEVHAEARRLADEREAAEKSASAASSQPAAE